MSGGVRVASGLSAGVVVGNGCEGEVTRAVADGGVPAFMGDVTGPVKDIFQTSPRQLSCLPYSVLG